MTNNSEIIDKLISLYGELDISTVPKCDRYLAKSYFVLNEKYEIELNKEFPEEAHVRLYDSADDYDMDSAPYGAYYDKNENVWCVGVDEEEFDAFDQTKEQYSYFEKIFAAEIIRQLCPDKNDAIELVGRRLYYTG